MTIIRSFVLWMNQLNVLSFLKSFFLSKLCFSFSMWSIAKLNVPPSQWDETINVKILCGVFDCLCKYFFWTRTTHGLGGKFSLPETSSWSNTWSFKLLGVLTKHLGCTLLERAWSHARTHNERGCPFMRRAELHGNPVEQLQCPNTTLFSFFFHEKLGFHHFKEHDIHHNHMFDWYDRW